MKIFKKITALTCSLALITGILAGCGNTTTTAPTEYDLYIFNGKSENADALEAVAKEYTDLTGVRVKVFSLGTTDVVEVLRAEMNSSNKPGIFSIGSGQLTEWEESGAVLDLNNATNPELKALAESIPEGMRLTSDGATNYGIPYNIEGYGLITNTAMVAELFGLTDTQEWVEDFKAATYDEFEQMVVAVDEYIQNNTAGTVTLNQNTYTFANEKGPLTSQLTGVFADAGAERWTYGDHMTNIGLNAVFGSIADARNATSEQLDALVSPLSKVVQTLELYSDHAAGTNGPMARGPEYINATTGSYDASVQLFADNKALFIKQGNWVYPNIEKLNTEILPTLTMLPIKIPVTQSDIAIDGMTVEQFNSSIPEFVPSYYAINAKVSEEEQQAAQDFLVWLNTTEAGKKAIVEEFQFVPFNADESVRFENPLNNDLIDYKVAGKILSNPFNGTPDGGTWGQNVFGSIIMEQYYTNPEPWGEDSYLAIAQESVQKWKESTGK